MAGHNSLADCVACCLLESVSCWTPVEHTISSGWATWAPALQPVARASGHQSSAALCHTLLAHGKACAPPSNARLARLLGTGGCGSGGLWSCLASPSLVWVFDELMICADAAEAVACNEHRLESGNEVLSAAVNLRAAAELSLGRPNAARAVMADLPQHADAGSFDKERHWVYAVIGGARCTL